MVEPFVLGSSTESSLKAGLLTATLGLAAGTKTAEYFETRAQELANLFERFHRSLQPNAKGNYGYRILETIRAARGWLSDQLRDTPNLKEVLLRLFRRLEAYVSAEQSKLIHDTTLTLSLVSDRAVFSPSQTRIILEIQNIGEGMADGLALEVLPMEQIYEVEDRYRHHILGDLPDKTPVQIESYIQPLVGANTSIDLCMRLTYNTLTKKEKKAQLPETNRSVWLYPEAEFVKVDQAYSISQPATTWFYGRQDVLQSMADGLDVEAGAARPMIIYGLKRAGKTSVVQRFIAQTLRERKLSEAYLPVYCDLMLEPGIQEMRNDGDFLCSLADIIARGLADARQPAKPPFDVLNFRADFEARPFSTFSQILSIILGLVQQHRLLVVLDEFATLYANIHDSNGKRVLSPEVFGFFSNTIQRTPQLAFIFTGSYVLLEMMRENAFDLAKICIPRLISFLDESSARRLVTEPLAQSTGNLTKGWLEYDTRVVDRIVSVTNRHPYLIQCLCMLLVDRMNTLKQNSVNLNDINSVIHEVVSKSAYETHLLTLWNEFDTPQHRLLSVVSAQSNGAHDWVSIDTILGSYGAHGGVTSPEDIFRTSSGLVDAELLEKAVSEGKESYRITIPLYHTWLKHHRPPTAVFGQ